MPLELYQRGRIWWCRGLLDDGNYVRRSLRTADEALAKVKAAAIEGTARERAILGDRAPKPSERLTFQDAVMLYNASPAEAGYLKLVIPHLGPKKLVDITPGEVRQLGRVLYPRASTDTWQRQVITPVRAVINNAHELGKGPAIRIRAFTKQERQKQDRERGKQSRTAKTPGSWPWLIAFRAQANPYLGALALFMFTTGARITQSLLIEPNHRDLRNTRLWLPEAKGHPAQWVDITPETVADLANLPPRNERVFGYVHRWGVYGAWKKACKNAGIEIILPHAAGRHGFGTELVVRHGVDPVTAAKAGRWSDPSLLLKTYAHSEDEQGAVKAAFRTGLVQASGGKPVKALQNKRKMVK